MSSDLNGHRDGARERDFWGHHLATEQEVIREVRRGPDPNTSAMLDAVEPLSGKRVLDFACGTGVTAAWLCERGAIVTGLDITPEAIDVARRVGEALHLSATFLVSDLAAFAPPHLFDAVVGRYALHHVDILKTVPAMKDLLVVGARASFLETMAGNPLLMFARNHVIGRFGVPRLGTLDEHPLTQADVEYIERHLGQVSRSTATPAFLRIFDRQVLRYRSSSLTSLLGKLDDYIFGIPGSDRWSYRQVLVFN